MTIQSSKFNQWLNTASLQLLLNWQKKEFDAVVPTVTGSHALQFGLPQQFLLNRSNCCHKFIADYTTTQHLLCLDTHKFVADYTAWPLDNECMDLVLLPLTLNSSADLTATLRETTRVLRPEGRLILSANNIFSLWGIARQFNYAKTICFKTQPTVEQLQTWVTHWHLKNWLTALGFQINSIKFGVYQLPLNSSFLIRKSRFLNTLGSYIWPICGAVYLIDATKKVRSPSGWVPNWQLLADKFIPGKTAMAISNNCRTKPLRDINSL